MMRLAWQAFILFIILFPLSLVAQETFDPQALRFANEAMEKEIPIHEYLDQQNIQDQAFRIEAARIAAATYDGFTGKGVDMSKDIQKYKIQSEKGRVEVAKISAKYGAEYTSRDIKNFEIKDEKALIEIAKIAAASEESGVDYYIKNFGIQDQKSLIEIAKIDARHHGATALIENYGIQDEKALIQIAKIAAENSGASTSWQIQYYGIRNEKALIEIAKIAAAHLDYKSLHYGGFAVENFGIKDEKELSEIKKIADAQMDKEVAKQIEMFRNSVELSSKSTLLYKWRDTKSPKIQAFIKQIVFNPDQAGVSFLNRKDTDLNPGERLFFRDVLMVHLNSNERSKASVNELIEHLGRSTNAQYRKLLIDTMGDILVYDQTAYTDKMSDQELLFSLFSKTKNNEEKIEVISSAWNKPEESVGPFLRNVLANPSLDFDVKFEATKALMTAFDRNDKNFTALKEFRAELQKQNEKKPSAEVHKQIYRINRHLNDEEEILKGFEKAEELERLEMFPLKNFILEALTDYQNPKAFELAEEIIYRKADYLSRPPQEMHPYERGLYYTAMKTYIAADEQANIKKLGLLLEQTKDPAYRYVLTRGIATAPEKLAVDTLAPIFWKDGTGDKDRADIISSLTGGSSDEVAAFFRDVMADSSLDMNLRWEAAAESMMGEFTDIQHINGLPHLVSLRAELEKDKFKDKTFTVNKITAKQAQDIISQRLGWYLRLGLIAETYGPKLELFLYDQTDGEMELNRTFSFEEVIQTIDWLANSEKFEMKENGALAQIKENLNRRHVDKSELKELQPLLSDLSHPAIEKRAEAEQLLKEKYQKNFKLAFSLNSMAAQTGDPEVRYRLRHVLRSIEFPIQKFLPNQSDENKEALLKKESSQAEELLESLEHKNGCR